MNEDELNEFVRDGLPGNKFSPTDRQVADELADVLTYLDLLAATLGVDLGRAAAQNVVPSSTGAAIAVTLAGDSARPQSLSRHSPHRAPRRSASDVF